MYCKHCGKHIDEKSRFCSFCGGNLESPFIPTEPVEPIVNSTNFKSDYIRHDVKKEMPVGIIMSAIMYFISAFLWFFIGSAQATISNIVPNNNIGAVGFWNIIISFVCIAIGIGILQSKKWSYDWGLGTAILNVLLLGYYYSENNSNFILFLLLIEVATIILLFSNREYFTKTSTKTRPNIDIRVLSDENKFSGTLHDLIIAEQNSFFGGNSMELLSLLKNACKTKSEV
ncbi:MAG: zinc ribbon domain-containing protein, partial [Bacteroidota bacterium]